MITHGRKCEIVAAYIANRMDTDDLIEYVIDDLYQLMKHGGANLLENYMEDYGLTEQHLNELGAE